MFKKTLLSATLAALCTPLMAGYYLIVPVATRTPGPVEIPIVVKLSAITLPAGAAGVAYQGYDFNQALQVTGDEEFSGAGVSWQVSSGELPAGLVLSAGGVISGTPQASGTQSFIVRATYKTKSGTRAYQVVVGSIEVSLQAQAFGGQAGAVNEYNIADFASVTGDPFFNASNLSFSPVGPLPAGLTLTPAGVLKGTPVGTGVKTFTVAASYGGQSAQQAYTLGVYFRSCRELLAANPGTASGWHTLDADGAGPAASKSYYCDMTSEGGGWTRVANEFSGTPTPWDGDTNGPSYTVAQGQIPNHTQTGFGKGDAATFVDYVPFVYSTGDIPVSARVSPKTGLTYKIHRSMTSHYGDHNPDSTLNNSGVRGGYNNTLTFNLVGGLGTWSFAPDWVLGEFGWYPGYGMAGALYVWAPPAFSWSVWVR